MRWFRLTEDMEGAPERWRLKDTLDPDTGADAWLRDGTLSALTLLNVTVSVTGDPLDFCLTSFGVPVALAPLGLALAGAAPGDVQVIPVHILPRDGFPGDRDRVAINCLRLLDCLDLQRSVATPVDNPDGTWRYRSVLPLFLDYAAIPPGTNAFRLRRYRSPLFVSGAVKEAMERAGCRGARFTDMAGGWPPGQAGALAAAARQAPVPAGPAGRPVAASTAGRVEGVLGTPLPVVLRPVVGLEAGGPPDMSFHPGFGGGTAIATANLSTGPGPAPANDALAAYEVAIATRHVLDPAAAPGDESPAGRARHRLVALLAAVARLSGEASLGHGDTCEFPPGHGVAGGAAAILVALVPRPGGQQLDFGVMLAMEIHRSELDFAREHGNLQLLQRLAREGHFPFSDLDREPVA